MLSLQRVRCRTGNYFWCISQEQVFSLNGSVCVSPVTAEHGQNTLENVSRGTRAAGRARSRLRRAARRVGTPPAKAFYRAFGRLRKEKVPEGPALLFPNKMLGFIPFHPFFRGKVIIIWTEICFVWGQLCYGWMFAFRCAVVTRSDSRCPPLHGVRCGCCAVAAGAAVPVQPCGSRGPGGRWHSQPAPRAAPRCPGVSIARIGSRGERELHPDVGSDELNEFSY